MSATLFLIFVFFDGFVHGIRWMSHYYYEWDEPQSIQNPTEPPITPTPNPTQFPTPDPTPSPNISQSVMYCHYENHQLVISVIYDGFEFPNDGDESNIISVLELPSGHIPPYNPATITDIKMEFRGYIHHPTRRFLNLQGFLTHDYVTTRLFGEFQNEALDVKGCSTEMDQEYRLLLQLIEFIPVL